MIGYVDAADGTGFNVFSNTIELKYTLAGDLNLTRTVTFADFAKLVANYGKPAHWDGGALTYGATVSFADFALLVANYGKQAVTSTTAAVVSAASAPAVAGGSHTDLLPHFSKVTHGRRRLRRDGINFRLPPRAQNY
jgi:hypothetical protein